MKVTGPFRKRYYVKDGEMRTTRGFVVEGLKVEPRKVREEVA